MVLLFAFICLPPPPPPSLSPLGAPRPLRELRGHVPIGAAKLKQITRPRWLLPPESAKAGPGGRPQAAGVARHVVVQGERSTKLTLFDASSGLVISRGELGGGCTTLAVAADRLATAAATAGEIAVAAAFDTGRIAFLVPATD